MRLFCSCDMSLVFLNMLSRLLRCVWLVVVSVMMLWLWLLGSLKLVSVVSGFVCLMCVLLLVRFMLLC